MKDNFQTFPPNECKGGYHPPAHWDCFSCLSATNQSTTAASSHTARNNLVRDILFLDVPISIVHSSYLIGHSFIF